MLSRIRDYFGMSHREARGFLILLLLTVFILLSPFLFRYFIATPKSDTSAADQQKLDSLLAKMETIDASRPSYNDNRDRTLADHYAEPTRRVVKRFNFNPNTISVAQWQALGLPGWLAERIDKYRSKGGRFRKKDDLKRIYNFPPDLYQELEPYMMLEEVAKGDYPAAREPGYNTEAIPGKSPAPERFERAKPAAVQPFDINTADTIQLARLKGIGSKLAGRIVKFRNALGGFVSVDQYGDIFGLDSLALAELQRFGKIQSPPQKINVNKATAEELDRHVYLSKRQAEIIVRYREQHGPFASFEALRPIRVLDAKTLEKLELYLDF